MLAVDLRAAFGRRVRELRKQLRLSQEELAHRAGLHWTYVGGIERGERNPALVNIGRLELCAGHIARRPVRTVSRMPAATTNPLEVTKGPIVRHLGRASFASGTSGGWT